LPGFRPSFSPIDNTALFHLPIGGRSVPSEFFLAYSETWINAQRRPRSNWNRPFAPCPMKLFLLSTQN